MAKSALSILEAMRLNTLFYYPCAPCKYFMITSFQNSGVSAFYTNHLFSLSLSVKKYKTIINLQLFTNFFTTKNIPDLKNKLKQELPLIFDTHCFNGGGLSFEEEVIYTPLGHLFEHILLEYLCDTKAARRENNICYKGLTTWDWRNNPQGNYVIEINIGLSESDLFISSLENTIRFITQLLELVHSPIHSFPVLPNSIGSNF